MATYLAYIPGGIICGKAKFEQQHCKKEWRNHHGNWEEAILGIFSWLMPLMAALPPKVSPLRTDNTASYAG